MRRKRSIWMVAAILLAGLWAWTQQSDNGGLHAPGAGSPGIGAPSSLPDSAGAGRGPDRQSAPRAGEQSAPARSAPAITYPTFLPPEAHAVLAAIADGGPYAYRQDGGVFQNREGLLPRQPRGYYREFTVATPRSHDRGARRIITGGAPPVEYFYTDDHYRSFRRFEPEGARQ